MVGLKFRNNPMLNTMRDGLNFAGFRFWTASLLPAVVGTTLPFWLGPPGFTFRPIIAIEFLLAAVLFHAGFSFFLAWFERDQTEWWSREKILGSAGLCLGFGCLIGFHINNNLQLLSHVYPGIFLVYGFCTFFVGVIYVVPPVCFFRQPGGEIVASYSLGMLPIIGAYLIQAGDITRTVYLASLPVIVMTGLWVWIDKLATYQMDLMSDRKNLVTYFGIHFSGRVGVPVIILLFVFTLLLGVFSASLNPLALLTFVLCIPIWRIVIRAWKYYSVQDQMLETRKTAVVIHSLTCIIIAISSIIPWLSIPLPILAW